MQTQIEDVFKQICRTLGVDPAHADDCGTIGRAAVAVDVGLLSAGELGRILLTAHTSPTPLRTFCVIFRHRLSHMQTETVSAAVSSQLPDGAKRRFDFDLVYRTTNN